MKENIDINDIATLSKLSLSEEECVRSAEEILAFTKYIQILEDYCNGDMTEQQSLPADTLREDAVCQSQETMVFDGYVGVPLTIGGEE